ncbi:MAG: protein-disulfide reductase DsbD family protein, partial [Gammaproteobacteria bacterium]|nr:protein-disulfide reductase DsbD family protein [Gammaproteobacteria bacterium]
MKRFFLFISVAFALTNTWASPLPADQAFAFSATAKNYQMALLQWKIAPNYYLYKNKFVFHVIKPADGQLGDPLYPNNTQTLKTSLGDFDVYAHSLIIPIPIIQSDQKNLVLQVKYQGCSKAGYCYPPATKIVSIDLAGNYMQPVSALNIDVAPEIKVIHQSNLPQTLAKIINKHSLFLMITSFFGFGILLSLTPCVLPMIPILSSIIIGQKNKSHLHTFLLSLFYVFGMAITYAAIGVLFGILGSNIQIIFQQPWIIVCFSLLFFMMALSLFGL